MRIPIAGRLCVALVLSFLILLLRRGAFARDIGPDAFGYRASEVPIVFEDLSGSGMRLLGRSSDDVASAPLAFPFTFYGVDYDVISWSTNGLVTFGGMNPTAENTSLAVEAPSLDAPSIAVLWDDWQFVQPGADATYFEVRGEEGSRRFIVQWNLAFEAPSSPSNVIFEVALLEGSNDILLSFLDTDTASPAGGGASATVGIRDAGGHLNGRSLEWSFNQGVINSRQSILYVAPTDTTPPMVTIASPVDGAVIGSEGVAVTATVVDESPSSVLSSPAGVAASLPEGGGGVSGLVRLVEGTNTIVLTATDASGNMGGASVAVVRDMTPPELSLISPASGAVLGDTPASFTISVRDMSATSVSIGSSPMRLPAGGGEATAILDLAEGSNRVEVTAIDAAGNVAAMTVTVFLDTTAPLVSIDSPADGASFGAGESPVPLLATVNDAAATRVASIPQGVVASLPAGGGIAAGAVALSEGANRITITAVDSSGRMGAASIVLHLDTTLPIVSLDSPSSGMALRGEVELAASAFDAGSGLARVEILVDGRSVASFNAPPFERLLDTSIFADGTHVITAAAQDREGNSSSSAVRVVIDNTPPVIAFSSPADGAVVAGVIQFSAQASDAGAKLSLIQILADGSAPSVDPSSTFSPAVQSIQLAGEEDSTRHADGLLALTALAVDAAGNESLARVTVQVDNTPPGTVKISPPSGSIVSGIVNITAEALELRGGTLSLFVDGELRGKKDSSPIAFAFDTSSRPDGMLVIRAVARDSVGNESSAVSTLNVDNVAVEMRLTPTVINLKPCKRGRDGWRDQHRLVIVHLRGNSLDGLTPVRRHGVELRVPGGSPVRALGEWRERSCKGRRERLRERLHVKFDRESLASSIRAGIAAGSIDPRAEIAVSLYADGEIVATAYIRVAWR